MFTRIIVPLDGSVLAESALPKAAELTRLTGAELTLVRVIDFMTLEKSGAYGLALEYAPPREIFDVEMEEADSYLRDVSAKLRASGFAVSTEILRGRVARVLADFGQPGDVVVMASHGRGGLSRWFLGSVAEDLVRRSTVPVMLIRAQQPPKQAEPGTVVVPASTSAVLV
jgi:nucleotide-binding universal stress UspA family protein